MSLSISAKSLYTVEPASLHLIPCTIEANSEANVSHYFTSAIRDDENQGQGKTVLQTSLRGRLLKGQEVLVPDGYRGVVLKEPSKPFVEEEDRSLRAAQSFDRFTYWNLETAPSVNDPLQQAMAWTRIAEALHSPVPTGGCSLASQGSVTGCR
ncbi:ribonuclease H2 subunit C-like [Diadema antillarum]|uniref:ribonuclease H2 subunit C-like n=1 Tax=Diadema antillarum TaxID=105358 RepID=UPI003A8BA551